MLEEITVWDFQTHAKKTVKLDQVTTLIGHNDQGKTALIRALAVACNILPPHKDFVRFGRKRFRIDLKVDGHTVSRRKGKGLNLYLLDGKKYKFDGTRTKVPAEVAGLLNVGPENFALQHDKHFWFFDTAGQVSKKLNEIVNLSVIDKTLAAAATEVKQAGNAVELARTGVKDSAGRVQTLKWVSGFSRRLTRVEGLERRAGIVAESSRELRSTLREYRSGLEGLKSLSACVGTAGRVVKMGNLAVRQGRKVKRLAELLRELKTAQRQSSIRVPDLSSLIRLRKVGDAQAERRRTLEFLIQDLITARDEVCRLNEELVVAERRLAKAGRNRKCPTCGQPVKKSSRSSRPIFTCDSGHPLAGRRKKTG